MNVTKRTKSAAAIAALYIMICLVVPNRSTACVQQRPDREYTDTIFIQKNVLSKTHRFTLTSDAENKVVFFSVRGGIGRVYQLYVFNTEGKLIKQTEIRNRQTTLIENIEKGTYFFEVFTDDMRIGNGQIAVR